MEGTSFRLFRRKKSEEVKSKHQIKKHERDALILDDNSAWQLDLFGVRTVGFWLLSDELEVDDSPFHTSITNVRSSETVNVRRISG